MNPVTHIREKIFGCRTQSAFAELIGTTQATVSRWEEAGRIPGSRQQVIREAAARRGLWDDRWFFEVPASASRQEGAAA